MERSLAGVLFLVSAVAFALSAGTWWMQRIVFTPDETRDTAAAMLEDPDIRLQLNTVITGAAAQPLQQGTTDLAELLENDVFTTRAGAAEMAPIMQQAHQRIIGLRDDEPIIVSGIDLIPILRSERAADMAPLTLPIEPIGVLTTTRSIVGWMIPVAAGVGLLALVIGFVARPDRRDILRSLGELAIALAAAMLVFGYLVPVQFLTAIDNRTWTHAMPRLALRTLPVVLGSAVIFGLVGTALVMASKSGGKRRQWSTPLSVTRYQGSGTNGPGWG